jgi:hypothetical protein
MERGKRNLSYRNMPPDARAEHYVQVADHACDDPNVSGLGIYQLDDQPGWRDAIDAWDSSMADKNGKLDKAFYALRAWFLVRGKKCIKQPLGFSSVKNFINTTDKDDIIPSR